MTATDEYGFIAQRDERGDVQIADCMGSGKGLLSAGGAALIGEIAEFIASRAREYAVQMVEELAVDDDEEDEGA